MKKIKIFLASSNELAAEREKFEIDIYRKCKMWVDKGVFLHLDIWEDLPARMSATRSQEEYNTFIREADLFVLLAYSKLGMYSEEEFEQAFGHFKQTQKPFIFTYFKTPAPDDAAESLELFIKKLKALEHFYCRFSDFNDLWNQFNKELERLNAGSFTENNWKDTGRVINQGDKSIYIEKGNNLNINIQ
jgi:hydroxymethylpyrimidine pyrophosphatase-like HAD family hydrolase